MRQQAGHQFAAVLVNQRALAHPAVVGLVVLQAEMGHMVAQAEQEVIVAVMPRPEKFACFGHQVHVFLAELGADVERGFAVRGDVHHVADGLAGWRHVHDAQVLTRNDRRIHQAVQ